MNEIIVRDDQAMAVSFSPSALVWRDAALERAALVARVTNADEQTVAVSAQALLRVSITLCESARVEVKAPVLDYGRRIDAAAKGFSVELEAEEIRLARLVGDYQAIEQAKLRAAEALRLRELNAIETARQAALAAAATHAERDKVNERAEQEAAAVPPAPPPIRAVGQTVREDWEITVSDVWALARGHPLCVTITPRLSEIRQLLDAGQQVCGVTAKRVTKSSVRVSLTKSIDV